MQRSALQHLKISFAGTNIIHRQGDADSWLRREQTFSQILR